MPELVPGFPFLPVEHCPTNFSLSFLINCCQQLSSSHSAEGIRLLSLPQRSSCRDDSLRGGKGRKRRTGSLFALLFFAIIFIIMAMTNNLARATRVSDYREFNWTIDEREHIKYPDIINFERAGAKGEHHCVMCGNVKGPNCIIPNQNKDVCRSCDSAYWLLKDLNVLVKFCKGCKKFSALMEFDEKPEASKCAKCRKRGRQNYYSRKQDEDHAAVLNENKFVKEKKAISKFKSAKFEKSNVTVPNNKLDMVNKSNMLPKLQSNQSNDINSSGETDKSLASTNSSTSCPSPSSYHISGQASPNTYQLNHSFSSPALNDSSDINILGFNPYDTSVDIEVNDAKRQNGLSRDAASLKVPYPFRPNDKMSNADQCKLGTPPAPTHTSECPDTDASIVSCSSRISDGCFSSSYLWPDTIKEMERNSKGFSKANSNACAGNGTVTTDSISLTDNQMLSCFQLPTGCPSGLKSSKGVKTTNGPKPSKGAVTGVAIDRRDSRESGKSSSSSSKNSSLSSIGSVGGFPIGQFGELGGAGHTSHSSTPGLLLSITPQSGQFSFTPRNHQGYDSLTPFSGFPGLSHSPFDSINTPDSTCKWDPTANALMNLANVSECVLTNTPPLDGQSSPSLAQQQPVKTSSHEDGDYNRDREHSTRKCSSDPTKSSAAGVIPKHPSAANTAFPPSRLTSRTEEAPSSPSKQSSSRTKTADQDMKSLTMSSKTSALKKRPCLPPSGAGLKDENRINSSENDEKLSCRTYVVSDGNAKPTAQSETAPTANSSVLSPHISATTAEDDNIYQVALEHDKSLELSPPATQTRKKRQLTPKSCNQGKDPAAKKLRL